MAEHIITREDLHTLKTELLRELDKRLSERQPVQRWFKSYQVKKLLSISYGKIQRLRASGLLPYSRIGSVILYDYYDIEKMIAEHREVFPVIRKPKSML